MITQVVMSYTIFIILLLPPSLSQLLQVTKAKHGSLYLRMILLLIYVGLGWAELIQWIDVWD